MSRVPLRALIVTVLALCPAAGARAENSASDSHAQAPTGDARADYGVTLALGGESARAESIFVTLLSHTHGDARALTNLGNLRLLRGETGVALAFYDRALRADSLDAGIHLNRATALMLMGDDARSQEAYALGVKLAGGLDHAQALMGLPPETHDPNRAAKKTMLDADQIRAMLKRAAASVPSDSSKGGAHAHAAASANKPPSAWRSAGPRSADGSESPMLLYWKR
jgi:tetratricopeptide (TPR) repeat protein